MLQNFNVAGADKHAPCTLLPQAVQVAFVQNYKGALSTKSYISFSVVKTEFYK
jgi:hypothetical protein